MPTNTPLAVLVVDDDEVDRQIASRFLEPTYSVLPVASAASALEASAHSRFACAVVDLHIPGSDTGLLVRTLLERSIAVVVLTGHGSEAAAVRTLQAGVHDYVSKNGLKQQALIHTVANAIEKNKLALQLRDKQQEIAWFAGIAAHDLRSPVRRVSQLIELALLQGAGATASARESLQLAMDDTRSLLALIDGLTHYMKAGRMDCPLVPVNLNEVAAQVRESLAVLIQERSASIVWPKLPTILGERTALAQLIQNLAANGIKYCIDAKPRIEISAVAESPRHWLLAVDDNGPGIPDDRRESLFQPFTRLATTTSGGKPIEGSGLGLAICRRIVDQHRGRIWIEDAPRGGTRVCVKLAAVPGAETPQNAVSRAVRNQNATTDDMVLT